MSEQAPPSSKQPWTWGTVVIGSLSLPLALTSWPMAAGMLALAALGLALYLLAETPLRRQCPEIDHAPGWKFRSLLPRINGWIVAALILVTAPIIIPWVGTFEWLKNAVVTIVVIVTLMRPRNEMNAVLALTSAALAGVTLSGLLPIAVIYLGYAAVALSITTSAASF